MNRLPRVIKSSPVYTKHACVYLADVFQSWKIIMARAKHMRINLLLKFETEPLCRAATADIFFSHPLTYTSDPHICKRKLWCAYTRTYGALVDVYKPRCELHYAFFFFFIVTICHPKNHMPLKFCNDNHRWGAEKLFCSYMYDVHHALEIETLEAVQQCRREYMYLFCDECARLKILYIHNARVFFECHSDIYVDCFIRASRGGFDTRLPLIKISISLHFCKCIKNVHFISQVLSVLFSLNGNALCVHAFFFTIDEHAKSIVYVPELNNNNNYTSKK